MKETQNIEVFSSENPLETKNVSLKVGKGCKILSHESYVVDAYKMYDKTCSSDMLTNIASYEAGTYKSIREGVVDSLSEDKAIISLSAKHTVAVDVNKNEVLIPGNTIDVVVSRKKGRIMADASSKSAKIERLKQELIKQIQTPTKAYAAVVKDIVYNISSTFNGFIVDLNGLKCFMPGAESDVVPLNSYTDLVGKTLYVMPVAESKDSIVVSHKEFLNAHKPSVLANLKDYMSNGDLVTGEVSSVKSFGVFILIDKCVPTLLSVSEMNSDTEALFKSGNINVGDSIEFFVEEIKDEKVTITQTASKKEGWDKLKEAFDKSNNYVLKGNVKNIFSTGVVIISEEFNGITFFLSSKVVNIDNLAIGNPVSLNVENVDVNKKTVRLKIVEE